MLEIAQGLTHTCLPTQAVFTNPEVLGPKNGLQESPQTATYCMLCLPACMHVCVCVCLSMGEKCTQSICGGTQVVKGTNHLMFDTDLCSLRVFRGSYPSNSSLLPKSEWKGGENQLSLEHHL